MKTSALTRAGDRFSDWLEEQVWFQSLKSKWEELEPENRRNARVAVVIAIAAVGLGSAFWSMSATSAAREKNQTKKELLTFLLKSEEEIRRLRSNPRMSAARPSGSRANWGQYALEVATQNGIDRGSVEALPEAPGNKTPLIEETEFGLKAKNITIRQLLRLVYGMETGIQPVRVRTLGVKTIGSEGYLEAELRLAGTTVLERK